MSDLCRLIWCALIGVFGRGLRCKPRTWSFDINSTCCGARYKTKARYKDLIRNGARVAGRMAAYGAAEAGEGIVVLPRFLAASARIGAVRNLSALPPRADV